jgi:hypothetical protein
MSDQLYITKKISLKKDFLMDVHSHELLSEIKGIRSNDPAYIEMWKNTPEISEHGFGGLYRTQFTSVEDIISFENAFDNALTKHSISDKHRNPLLYLISFIGEDYQAQSIERNRFNRLREYTKFILDLHANCIAHFENMIKNEEYEMIHDDATTEDFFARKTFIENTPIDEIIEYRSENTPGDLIQYLRVPIYQTELYVPHDMLFSVISESKLRTFEGEQMDNIIVPPYLQSEVFKFTIDYMLCEHKKYDTAFYKALSKPGFTRRDFTKFYSQYKRHSISYAHSMLRVGKVISEYLIANKLSKNQSTVAEFLFDYFSLFKAIPLKNKAEFPTEYSELTNFYNRNGITKATIRYMMKDAVIVGGI